MATTRMQANAAMKQEQKSFEFCVNMIYQMRSLPEVKSYLSERSITVDYLTKRVEKQLVCKADLFQYCKLHEFIAANGDKYQAIYRKDKDGKIIEAKWSVWRVLCAIDARYNAIQEKEKKAASIKKIEKAEKSRQALAAELKAKTSKDNKRKAA